MLERVESCLDHIVRIRRANRLGQHVLNTRRSHHRAHRSASDHSCAFRSGFQQHPAGSEAAQHEMRNAGLSEIHLHQVFLRRLNSLADGLGDFFRQAIRKGIESAKKNLMKVNLTQTSIPHLVLGRFGSGRVLLKPAPEGTGVIAGGAVRAVMTSAGVQNVLTKSIGTTNPHNVIKATFDALKKLKNRELVASMRGKVAEEL